MFSPQLDVCWRILAYPTSWAISYLKLTENMLITISLKLENHPSAFTASSFKRYSYGTGAVADAKNTRRNSPSELDRESFLSMSS